ncbi:putative short chain dehydrogenase [Leptomonas pyrrhocoris]|uniref:Putative short chain dehydrogenase n=1 Tax=Leptomonas pyrrhocoris TaxID=157538 RepID=A0A0M9GA23_LEPPY|nr:putative short chain dehydrogenase [Leptomonas pyrrhocoris]XP_015664458.1 putative short chain dehydrogenase [Leptomonas pyrrhocoris]XP_015664459.1 putative short chain dehydrogenase [Leptomonas pyrrhocoris]XP_015664460.1 putative short chain dehydrogenase [Leptomonas pyrrhocoris]XP_015664461.1 putative short chain dehydrogenase [Leptomonas pyrrhocoris]KPA86018.1 putative short chain dehydrogenase [Leptomonas pyrrhocoris]KPA86019.1 putative short chain dehydrogenase [Leptomonas pyrrhocoris|eukprot:XP_015664457.1 putative short chain dehydrogenase [Leptomonas pyrrhocoris]
MKAVFITGGNRGIGLETARQMGKLGYHVIISARKEEDAKKAVADLFHDGLKVDYVIMDTEDTAAVEKAAAEVSKLVNGVLDALINNAGCACPCGDKNTANLEDMRKCFEVNVIGTANVTNHFLEMVKKAPAGRIVNVSSIMGSFATTFIGFEYAPYTISKAALNMYTVKLAAALKDTNVKVNCGHPGWVKTEMGGPNAELEVTEGAETSVYLATLPADGPTGGYFHKKDSLPW